jgi:hypothetical protein
MKKIILVLPIIALLFSPVLVLGTVGEIDTTEDAPVIEGGLTGLMGLMQTVINFLFWFLMALTVVFIIWAAYLFLTSAGDEAQTKKARNIILYAVVAVIVAVLSQTVFQVVLDALGKGS